MPVRMQILVDAKHKRLAEKLARANNTSASDVFRRALESYDPDRETEGEKLATLLKALKDANTRARAALGRAEKEVRETLDYYAQRSDQPRKAAAR